MKSNPAKQVFMIGIGGSGMMPLARLARIKGWTVFGSDHAMQALRRQTLLNEQIRVFDTHDHHNLDSQNDIIVYSSAIAPQHPELMYARQNASKYNWQLMHRMDFLQLLLQDKDKQIAIAGTHGKTSTSSLAGWLLLDRKQDPDIIVGGHPLYLTGQVRGGQSKLAVYETDESDASFLKSKASYRLVLNIDQDHLEHYGSFEGLQKAFCDFIRQAKFAILNLDDPILRSWYSHPEDYGLAADQLWFYTTQPELLTELSPTQSERGMIASIQAQEHSLRLESCLGQKTTAELKLPLPGIHFASNGLGLILLLRLALPQLSLAELLDAASRFPGVERRMQLLGNFNGVDVYDDYAHHPVEIKAVIKALKERLLHKARLHVVFQPHRYSRMAELYQKFAASLIECDALWLLPLYSAGEKEIPGINSQLLLDCATEMMQANQNSCELRLLANHDFKAVFQDCLPGDILVFLGAGDISGQIRSYLQLE